MEPSSGWPEFCLGLRPAGVTLADLLDPALEIDADKAAIIFDDEETSYRVLDETADRVANGLIDLGLKPGDRVAVQLENRPEFLEIFIAVMQGGWLHTGDLGRVVEDGYVFIVGRTKDLIIVSGYNVYPVEVETVILRHPRVLDCAVIGIPDDYQGESVCAVVVARPGDSLTEEELNTHCRQHLAAFKCPRVIEFRDEIPKSASGKILTRVLRDEAR